MRVSRCTTNGPLTRCRVFAVRAEGKSRAVGGDGTYTNQQLQEFLHCWELPGGVLAPAQARALLAWSATPDSEREALTASIAATEQQVEAERLAPNQRRGHVSWLDRVKHFFGRE
jgi:hypothetical protein